MRRPTKAEWLVGMSAVVTLGSAIYLLAMTVLLYGTLANGFSTLKVDGLTAVDFLFVILLTLGNFAVSANLLQRLSREGRASALVQGNEQPASR
jgi:hypothetical protein